MNAVTKRTQADRKAVRAQVVPTELRGLLTKLPSGSEDAKNESQFPFLIWDVSIDGLGLMVSGPMALHEKVKITIGQPYLLQLSGEVVWCEPHEHDGFRCGIRIIDNDRKLAAVYDAFVSNAKPETP